MKLAIQYVKDVNGNTQAVQLPLSEWERVLAKLKKYEQTLNLNRILRRLLSRLQPLKTKLTRPKTLNEFLNEL